MTHEILVPVQFDNLFLTYFCTGILWYMRVFSQNVQLKKIMRESKRENMLRIYKYRKSCYREKSDTVVHTEKQQNGWHWLIVFEC